jgi:hypothetical protein
MSDRCGNIRDGHPCGVPVAVRVSDPTDDAVAYYYCETCWPWHWEAAFEMGFKLERIPAVATDEAAQ